METKLNFNSQICTTREQSERLLTLGLKKETADMCHRTNGMDIYFITAVNPLHNPNDIPAWSLHRLIEMMPKTLVYEDKHFYLRIEIGDPMVGYFSPRFVVPLEYFYGNDTIYDDCISCIEWLIKEGYFNKEYLV